MTTLAIILKNIAIPFFFLNWPSCKDLAADLVATCDDEMELNI